MGVYELQATSERSVLGTKRKTTGTNTESMGELAI